MPNHSNATAILLLVACFAAPAVADESASVRVAFNRDIRPILASHCFTCHGPDEKTRESELRLDERGHALADRGGYAALVPGDPKASEIFRRILTEDDEERMPPSEAKKRLTAREIKLLRQWIEQGAEYQQHWSFLPIVAVKPPVVGKPQNEWVRNPIDRFVIRQQEQRGLKAAPLADPQTLIRRMYLDLLGLLPEPAAVDVFTAEFRSQPEEAVRKLAAQLLNNPHYGERWGRHWLDQARYADSHGYTIDGDRVMWPYRDWVIQAINSDLPFDRFTIEQLAGDLLPRPTKRQLVATGFHRNTLINQEGGTDDEQFRNEEVVDRVNTTGAVWLGLTVGCAQCHSHKFDPISQKEYYQLFAFFNHTADVNNVGPTIEVSEGELMMSSIDRELTEELEKAQAKLAEAKKSQAQRQASWEAQTLLDRDKRLVAAWRTLAIEKMEAAGGANLKLLDDQSVLAGKGGAMETYTLQLPFERPLAAVRLRVLPDDSLPKKGPGRASNGNFVLSRLELSVGDKQLRVARAQADHAQPKFPITNVLDGKPETGWAINIGKGSRPGVKMNSAHEAHFIFDEPVRPGADPLTIVLRHEINANYNIGRFAIDASSTAPASFLIEQIQTALAVPTDKRTPDQKQLLTAEFAKADSVLRAAESSVAVLRKRMGLGRSVKSMVMRELAKPRETYIHLRGDFLQKDKATGALTPNVPTVLPPLQVKPLQDKKATRLDLARWLVSPDNPLTARVTVNRVWMRYFGRGLVETENDFGTQGSYPTHPELLDWLANYLIESKWSMKKLHTMIVTSATYRQASRRPNDGSSIDPRNMYLSRQNRLRVDAEIIRDVGLSASGLLNLSIGGPSVRPPQPSGVYAFTQTKKAWTADSGDNRYRRGLYTRFYRSAPYPMLSTFDAPDFQSVCTRRPRSNTPMQSLTMANDMAFFEMAQGLAKRLLNDVPEADAKSNSRRVNEAFRICYSRSPTSTERNAVLAFQQQQERLFKADAAAAKAVAPSEQAASHSIEFAASWTAVARALMNTDEFVTRE